VSAIFGEQCSQAWTVQAIIDGLQHGVKDHMQSAEQLDDLTLPSLKGQD
jgi:hypothetical protein